MISTVTVETMRKSDAWTIENLVSSAELMRRAGEAVFKSADWKEPVAVVCGKGNNAGDGYVTAALLHDAGIDCTVILLSEAFSQDGKYYYDICRSKGVKVIRYAPGMDLSGYAGICDCIFGTGFSGEPQGIFADAIRSINSSGAYVVSTDINSGLNGDTGLGSLYVVSDLTVSIGSFKPGHFKGLAYGAMKDRVNADIGIRVIGDLEMIREPDLIVLVDLISGSEQHFRDAGAFAQMNRDFEGLDLFERSERYARQTVALEDREMFLKEMDIEKIRSSVEEGRICSLQYHAVTGGEKKLLETSYIPWRGGLEGKNMAVKTVRVI